MRLKHVFAFTGALLCLGFVWSAVAGEKPTTSSRVEFGLQGEGGPVAQRETVEDVAPPRLTIPELQAAGLISGDAGSQARFVNDHVDVGASSESDAALDASKNSRQGGDTCDTAFIIDSLPFTDSGSTFGYNDDFSMQCINPAISYFFTSDVVYAFTPSQDVNVKISLCDDTTDFRNVLFVLEGDCEAAQYMTCNEAVCATAAYPAPGIAELGCIALTAGETYYIVIDGILGSGGNYVLDVSECAPCALECDANATPEGEDACYPGYVDTYNSGCKASGEKYVTTLTCGDVICGTSGSAYGLYSAMDRDWYEVIVTEDTRLTFTLQAQFRANLNLAANGGVDDCEHLLSSVNVVYQAMPAANPCMPATLQFDAAPGTYWVYVAPTEAAVSCDRKYELSLDCESTNVPRGACCIGENSCVDNISLFECSEYYGSPLWHEGQACDSVSCPPRLNGPNCENPIAIDVPSTTWATTEGGDIVTMPSCDDFYDISDAGCWFSVIGNGSRLTATTCRDDAVFPEGRLSVFCAGCSTPKCATSINFGEPCGSGNSMGNTVSWCSEYGVEYLLWWHRFDASVSPYDILLQVSDDGAFCTDYPDCYREIGACCLADECFGDGMLSEECDAVGGRFYIGETCGTMTCENVCPGDTKETAIEITQLPYHGDGDTVPCVDNYFQLCDWSEASFSNDARDVVYKFTPAESVVVDISLCANSKMDTKMSVYEDLFTPAFDPESAFACSNDDCTSPSFSSEGAVTRIECLQLQGGSTYYILIDGGVFSWRGYYTIDVTEARCAVYCDVTCSPTATPEGEPVIEDGYVDSYNGGCNASPAVFQTLACGDTICGVLDTFVTNNAGYRDTDWYAITITEPTEVTASLTAECDAAFGFVNNNGVGDCAAADGQLFVAAEPIACENAELVVTLPAGEWWLVVLPQDFAGLEASVAYELSVICNTVSTADGACCLINGTCQVVNEAECFGLGGEFNGAGTLCDTDACAGLPVNDDCQDAFFLAVPSSIDGTTYGATLDSEVGQIGVWYKVTGTGNVITLSTCDAVTDFDTFIEVYCNGCGAGSMTRIAPLPIEAFPGEELTPYQYNDAAYRSDDDWFCKEHGLLASTHTFCSQLGSEYLVYVYGYFGARGDFRLHVTDGEACVADVQCDPAPQGACCIPDAPYCIITTQADCAGVYGGDESVCDVNDCNSNSIPDACEIANGLAVDCNENGIPDDCELCGDLDADGDVDYDDYVMFRSAFGGLVDGTPAVDACCDYDGSGAVGLADYNTWLACYRDFIGDEFAGPPSAPNTPTPGISTQGNVKKRKLPTGATLKQLRR